MKFSRVSQNTLTLFANQIYSKFLAVLFFALAARTLGISNFGKYTLVLTFVSFFYILSDWGLSTLTIRDVAREIEQTKKYLQETIVLRILLSFASYLILISVILLLNYSREIVILVTIIGLSLFSNNILNTYNAIFSAREKMYIPALLGMFFSTLFFIFGSSILLLGFGLVALVSATVILGIANIIVTVRIMRFQYRDLREFIPRQESPRGKSEDESAFGMSPRRGTIFSFDYTFYKKILKQATPYAILSLLSIIYFRIDTIMLSKLKPLEAVGIYNAAYKIIEFLRFIPICLMGAYFPQMSRQAKTAISELRQDYLKTTKLLLAIILPLAIIFSLFSKSIILLIFGSSFLPAAYALRILIWAGVIMYINAPVGNILYNSNKLSMFIPLAIINTLLNVILNFIFIPKWSYLGASFTTLITEITGFFIQIWLVRKILFTTSPCPITNIK